MKMSIKIGILVLLMVLGTAKVSACTYMDMPQDKKFEAADVVFFGKAIGVESGITSINNVNKETATSTLEVSRVWKGNVPKDVKIVTYTYLSPQIEACGPWKAYNNYSYLVYGKLSSTTNAYTLVVLPTDTNIAAAQGILGQGKEPLPVQAKVIYLEPKEEKKEEPKPVVATTTKPVVEKLPPTSKANPNENAMASATPIQEQVNPAGKVRPSFLNRVFVWFKNLF
jgi:hypothetical protein